VQIALMNNRSLQATLAEIGISQADFAQATRLKNPEFSASVRFPDAAPRLANTEFSLVQDFLDLLILPLRKKVAAQQLEQTKLHVTDEVLHLVAEVKTACYNVQARQQLVDRLQLILDINDAAAELAKKQLEAGTIKELEFVNQQVTYNQSKRDLAHAQMQLRSDRERLTRPLGLWGADTGWKVAEKLPTIPEKEIAIESLESLALEQRADLAAARQQVEAISRTSTLTRNTRFLPTDVKMGVNTGREPDRARVTGPKLDLELPIFDQEQAQDARLQAQRLQAQAQLDAMTVNARSEVRKAHALFVANRKLADSYRTIFLPQRVKILDLTLQQYNFMLKGVYDLLLAKQNEVEAERDYIKAWSDYWNARADC
jgi:cobalt-zinc-cadmium efflux system outer membrane protein